jgi:hypothetical protein
VALYFKFNGLQNHLNFGKTKTSLKLMPKSQDAYSAEKNQKIKTFNNKRKKK